MVLVSVSVYVWLLTLQTVVGLAASYTALPLAKDLCTTKETKKERQIKRTKQPSNQPTEQTSKQGKKGKQANG